MVDGGGRKWRCGGSGGSDGDGGNGGGDRDRGSGGSNSGVSAVEGMG